MSLDEATKFVVVAFENYELPDGKKAVELVPKTWLHCVEDKWFSCYPPENEYIYLSEWVKDEKPPDEAWVSFEVKLIKQAKSYNKGVKRLEKAFNTTEITSTESEDQRDPIVIQNILDLNADAIIRELENIPVIVEASPPPSPPPNQEPTEGDSSNKRKLATHEDLLAMEKRIKKSFNSMKSSILYEMKEFWQKLAANSVVSVDFQNLLPPMPFESDEDFQNFDESLQNNENHKSALIAYITRIIICEDNFREAVQKILKGILAKSIQLQYSACGRVVHGVSKKKFSATNTFATMIKLLEEKYPSSKSSMVTYISRWFSGAVDRDRGKSLRQKNV